MKELATLNALVVYDSKYGNTKKVAEQILEGLKENEGIDTTLGNIKEITPQQLADYDALIIGAPNHMGQPSRASKKFIDQVDKQGLKVKWAAAFDTYFQRERYFGKAMKKLEKHLNEKLPNLKLIQPGLSIRVTGVNGPIAEGELPKAKEFGLRIAKELVGSQTSINTT